MVISKTAIIQNNNADRQALTEALRASGCEVMAAYDGAELLECVSDGCEAAIVDSGTLDMWERGFLHKLRAQASALPLVLTIESGSAQSYMAMLSTSAWDFLTKPFSTESVSLLLHRLGEQKLLLEQNRYLWGELEAILGPAAVATRDSRMMEILRQVGKVAQTDAPVMILGELGTETDRVARLLHKASGRKNLPFIRVDCRLPENQLAEKLCGPVSLCRLAGGGTVFLDEVTEIGSAIQAKLLRILEDHFDARLICATSKDPYEQIEKGSFRRDLFFRINSAQVFLPPLRERTTDIPLLAGAMMDELGMHRPDGGWDELAQYDWPGNTRELEMAVRLAAIRGDCPASAAEQLLPMRIMRKINRRR